MLLQFAGRWALRQIICTFRTVDYRRPAAAPQMIMLIICNACIYTYIYICIFCCCLFSWYMRQHAWQWFWLMSEANAHCFSPAKCCGRFTFLIGISAEVASTFLIKKPKLKQRQDRNFHFVCMQMNAQIQDSSTSFQSSWFSLPRSGVLAKSAKCWIVYTIVYGFSILFAAVGRSFLCPFVPSRSPEPQAAEPESESDAELSWVHCATNGEDVHCSRFQLGILFYIWILKFLPLRRQRRQRQATGKWTISVLWQLIGKYCPAKWPRRKVCWLMPTDSKSAKCFLFI